MTHEQLRARQQPLKDQYRNDPQCAIIPMQAEGRLGDDLTCHVASSHAGVSGVDDHLVAGLHPATGGDEGTACSAEMLLQAFTACAGVTLQAVATSMQVDVRGGTIRANAAWDARGTLAVDRTAPVGLTDLRLLFDLDTDADSSTLDRLVQLTERYCVVLQTLQPERTVTATWSRIETPTASHL